MVSMFDFVRTRSGRTRGFVAANHVKSSEEKGATCGP